MSLQTKNILRDSIKQLRKSLPLSYQQQVSAKICAQIIQLQEYRSAKNIALYKAHNGEVNLDAIWHKALLQKKFCYFPVIGDNKTLTFLPTTAQTQFHLNQFGILEPDVSKHFAMPANKIDLILMPLVAFDEHGTRLGMGGGYYDRSLSRRDSTILIGVAYDFQRQPFIIAKPWDIPLHAIVTQSKIYWSKK